MKKLFTILLVSVFTINTTFSQVEQGTVVLGATSDLSETAWSMVALSPKIGYFLSDQIVAGLQFNMGSSTMEVDNMWDGTTTSKGSNMTIGPWVRYYMSEMVFLTADVAIGSGSDKVTHTGDDDPIMGDVPDDATDKSGGMDLEIGAGASIFWGDHIAFEPMFGLSMGSSWVQPDGGDKTNGPSTMNVGFKIGVCVMLGN